MMVTVRESELDDPSFRYGDHLLNDLCVCVCVYEMMGESYTAPKKLHSCQMSILILEV
jgi:hypothetical protein